MNAKRTAFDSNDICIAYRHIWARMVAADDRAPGAEVPECDIKTDPCLACVGESAVDEAINLLLDDGEIAATVVALRGSWQPAIRMTAT